MPYKDKVRQREYQRKWVRHKRGSTVKVRQATPEDVSNSVYDTIDNHPPLSYVEIVGQEKIPKQSHNPMKVGYVPPKE